MMQWFTRCCLLLMLCLSAQATEIQLRVLQTADLHMYLSDYDFFRGEATPSHGLVRTASLIKTARQQAANVILIDNGDLIQGNPLGDYRYDLFENSDRTQVHPLESIMTHLAYDVGNIGNHEFNFGLPYLQDLVARLPFPYVCANVFQIKDDAPLFQPFVVLSRKFTATDGSEHALKVGVIGVVPPQIMNWDKGHIEGKLRVIDMRDAVRQYMPRVREAGADVVLVVAHAGIVANEADQLEENAVVGITKIPGVTAVFAGHHHAVFPGPTYADIPGVDLDKGTINGVPVVMPGFWGSHLGLVDLSLKQEAGSWQVVAAKVENRAIAKREGVQVIPLVAADPEIAALLDDDVQKARVWLEKPIGKLDSPLQSYFTLVADSSVIQFVQDAQRWYVQQLIQGTELEYFPVLSAAAPFKTGYPDADAFVDIPPGDLSLKEAAEIYVYPNSLKVLKLNGLQIREWLERAAGLYAQIDPELDTPQALLQPGFQHYNFDLIDGVTYQIDITQPSRYDEDGKLVNADYARIENLRWRKVPLRDSQEFLLVTNSYRAYGGGSFPGAKAEHVVLDAPDLIRDILVRYVRANQAGLRVHTDHNWSLKPLQNVKLIYPGSPSQAAIRASEKLGHVKALESKSETGFQNYQLSWMKWVEFPNRSKAKTQGHTP